VFLTPQYLALVLEYANFGDLHTYVMTRGGLAEEQARWFFQQLILAVDFCHRMGISNRDIKLENILLAGDSQPLLKLADFGFSKSEHGQSAPSTRVGTIMYMAPEVLSFSAKDGSSYDARQADVWSCGVVLYAMLSGRYPFRNEADLKLGKAQAMRAIINRVLQKQVPPLTAITPSCQDLLQKLLEHSKLSENFELIYISFY
jgi:serine/threonine-protein kinase SRK2